jgi:menaquinone-9 beta-reductase
MAMPFSLAMESRLNQIAFEPTLRSDCLVAGGGTVDNAPEVPGCPSSLTVEDAAAINWDATVIGAGPTGALAARQLAARGLRTLLVDKSAFPRPKVCGGCISGLGRRILESVGLEQLLEPPGAMPLGRFDLAAGGRRVSLELPPGAAISRFHFDSQLVQHAVRAGATFVAGTTTVVRGLAGGGCFRTLALQQDDRQSRVRARIVIVADGLGRTSLKHHRAFASQIAPASRIGLGAMLPSHAFDIAPGCVLMSVAREGYVGMVQIPGDAINLAAAVAPQSVRERGPAEAVREILRQAGVNAPVDLDTAEWRGTGLLTRQSRRISARRLLVLGDAAGYVEPFTGEGMTWGMLSAVLVTPLVEEWLGRDTARNTDGIAARQDFDRLARTWSAVHRAQISHRQRDCRVLSSLLRRPLAVRAAMSVISLVPGVVKPVIGHYWNSGKGVELDARVQSFAETTLR